MSNSKDNISEKIADLTLKVSNYKVLKGKEDDANAFRSVEMNLAEIDSGLNEFETAIDIMIENKIEIRNIDSISNIYKMANDYDKSFQENSDSISTFKENKPGKGNFKHEFLPKCTQLKSDLDIFLKESLRNWANKKLPENLNSDVTEIFLRVASKDLKQKVSAIDKKLKKIENISNELPKEKNDLKILDENVQSVKKEWDQIEKYSGKDFSKITKFLKDALGYEGAKYEDFTPKIKDWFEEHGELKNARIKFLTKPIF
jgi:hypothetical protein